MLTVWRALLVLSSAAVSIWWTKFSITWLILDSICLANSFKISSISVFLLMYRSYTIFKVYQKVNIALSQFFNKIQLENIHFVAIKISRKMTKNKSYFCLIVVDQPNKPIFLANQRSHISLQYSLKIKLIQVLLDESEGLITFENSTE